MKVGFTRHLDQRAGLKEEEYFCRVFVGFILKERVVVV